MMRAVAVILIITAGRWRRRGATVIAGAAAVKIAAVAGAKWRALALGLRFGRNQRGDTRAEQDGEQYFFHRLVLDSTRASCAYSTNAGDKTRDSSYACGLP